MEMAQVELRSGRVQSPEAGHAVDGVDAGGQRRERVLVVLDRRQGGPR